MAFPTVVEAAESATTTAGTSHVVNLPITGNVAGQTFVMFMAIGSTAATLNALTGWVELADVSAANELKVLWRKSTGAEGSTTTFTSSAATRSATVIYRISGAIDPAVVPPQISAVATGTSVNPNSATLSPTGGAKDYLWFSAFAKALEEADDDTWVTAAPANYNNLAQKTAGTAGTDLGGMVGVARRTNNTATEDPGNFTVAISAAWRAYTVAVHPITTVASQDTTLTLQPVADPAYTRLDVSVIASGDDAGEDASSGDVGVLPAGILNTHTTSWMAFRFQNITIPRNAQIASAILTMVIDHNDKNDAEGNWYGNAIDHSATFTETAASFQISTRARTTASVAWTANDLGAAGAAVSPPNLAAPVNEVIDRPGWNPGAALTLIYDHTSDADEIQISSFDHLTAAAPSLSILWAYRPAVADTAVNLTVSPIADSTVAGPTVTFDPERFVDFPGSSGAYASTADRAGLDVTSLDSEAHWWNPARSDTPDNASGYLELPHHSDFNFAGDHDWRIEYTIPAGETSPNRNRARLMTKHLWNDVNDSWYFWWYSDGSMEIGWDTSAGAGSPRGTVFTGMWTPGHQAHKFWLDVDDGATHWVLRHYTSDSSTIAGPWTLANTTTSGAGQGPTTIFNSTAPITLGAYALGNDAARLKIHAFEYRSGNDGTLVAQLNAKNYTGVRSYDPAADGMSVVFEDDFPGSALSSNWIDHPPWFGAPGAGDVTVANSILRIRTKLDGGDENNDVILTGTGGSADPTGEAFQFGYVEARIRYSDDPWTWPAFWLLSTAWMDLYPNYATDPAGCPAGNRNSEIDILDGGGLNRVWSILHLNTSDPCSVADQTKRISSILDETRSDPADRMNDWHTYGCRWTANYIYTYYDGQLLGSMPTFATTAQNHNVWFSCKRYVDGVLSSVLGYTPEPPKPAEVWMDVDWVRIWQ